MIAAGGLWEVAMGHGARAAARMVTLGEARGVWRFVFLLFPPVDML